MPGIPRDLHCDQPVTRQYNTPMAGNPCNPAMSPHAVFQPPSHHTELTEETGRGGRDRKMLMSRTKQPFHDPGTAMMEHASTMALSMQYYMNTTDWKYQ